MKRHWAAEVIGETDDLEWGGLYLPADRVTEEIMRHWHQIDELSHDADLARYDGRDRQAREDRYHAALDTMETLMRAAGATEA